MTSADHSPRPAPELAEVSTPAMGSAEPSTGTPSASPQPSPERPPRRVRYSGTHPRGFQEKYKELNPEKYAEDIKKVLSRGQTPAGMHVPILWKEILDILKPSPGQVALDCTLGYGGHAEKIAEKLCPAGRLIGVDLDSEELRRTQQRLTDKGLPVSVHHGNFAGLVKIVQSEGLDGVDLLLADLGVSSMQLDRPDRGFSFKHDGPLDMRLDRSRGQSAALWLKTVKPELLEEILLELGDEPDAKAIASAIKEAVEAQRAPETTRDLLQMVFRAKGIDPKKFRRDSAFHKHPAARTFQAIRMTINREKANLEHLLRMLPSVLKPGGRAAILSFHSGERDLVQKSFSEGLAKGWYSAGNHETIRPTYAEIYDNPRARSAHLHWVQRSVLGLENYSSPL